MRGKALRLEVAMFAALASCLVQAAPSASDDRIAISANGSTLSGTNGGGGGALGWLHNFDADTLAGVAAEHQVLADANWTFGSLSGSLTRGPADQRYGVYGEVHEGAGHDVGKAFRYSIVAAGVTGTYYHRLTAQLEDKQIDVETTHGNLPKVGLSYLWGPQLSTSASYSYSFGGNLGTRLAGARIDWYGGHVNLLAGGAFGQASPVVLNLQSGIVSPGSRLKEGYVGVSAPLKPYRGELTLVADYLELSGIKRATLTLGYVFHPGAGSAH
jgi:hypothetical protein